MSREDRIWAIIFSQGSQKVSLLEKHVHKNITYTPNKSALKNALRGPICVSALFNFVLFVLF